MSTLVERHVFKAYGSDEEIVFDAAQWPRTRPPKKDNYAKAVWLMDLFDRNEIDSLEFSIEAERIDAKSWMDACERRAQIADYENRSKSKEIKHPSRLGRIRFGTSLGAATGILLMLVGIVGFQPMAVGLWIIVLVLNTAISVVDSFDSR